MPHLNSDNHRHRNRTMLVHKDRDSHVLKSTHHKNSAFYEDFDNDLTNRDFQITSLRAELDEWKTRYENSDSERKYWIDDNARNLDLIRTLQRQSDELVKEATRRDERIEEITKDKNAEINANKKSFKKYEQEMVKLMVDKKDLRRRNEALKLENEILKERVQSLKYDRKGSYGRHVSYDIPVRGREYDADYGS